MTEQIFHNDPFKFKFIFFMALTAMAFSLGEGFISQKQAYQIRDLSRELILIQDLLERDNELFSRQIKQLRADLISQEQATMDELCLGYDEYDADSIYDSELGMPKQ